MKQNHNKELLCADAIATGARAMLLIDELAASPVQDLSALNNLLEYAINARKECEARCEKLLGGEDK